MTRKRPKTLEKPQKILTERQSNITESLFPKKSIVRLGPDQGEVALLEPHVKAFNITGKPMKNWILVKPEGVEGDDQLKDWIQRAVKFVGKLPAQ